MPTPLPATLRRLVKDYEALASDETSQQPPPRVPDCTTSRTPCVSTGAREISEACGSPAPTATAPRPSPHPPSPFPGLPHPPSPFPGLPLPPMPRPGHPAPSRSLLRGGADQERPVTQPPRTGTPQRTSSPPRSEPRPATGEPRARPEPIAPGEGARRPHTWTRGLR
ncbi:DUF5133 domain-containing protein [Streptomyces sp. NPDC048256]|uniref:DUF5133 domain-containing protein n=1 Tax=Streptomyces sp. NPDC048256 TaxID=3154613 RepID=UPI0033EF679E